MSKQNALFLPDKRKRIGLFGGSFDPPHLGHLTLAQDAYENLDLESVWFIPTYLSPHKEAYNVSPNERLEMVKLMLAGDDRFKCCDLEVESGAPQYSVNTVCTLKERHPDTDFFWLIGADQLRTLPRWKDVRKLAAMATPVVFNRPGYPAAIPPEVSDLGILQVEIHEVMISSSEIRDRKMRGLPIYMFLHPAVNHHIETHHYYTK